MIDVLGAFQRNSDAWDYTFNLPTVPIHNNPWLYCAYALRIARAHGIEGTALEIDFLGRVKNRLAACRVRSGLYHKFPGGIHGLTSLDEILGMAYLNQEVAKEIYLYLIETDGIYENTAEGQGEGANVFRIFWARYVIRGLAGLRLNLISQTMLGCYLLFQAVTHKKASREGSVLRMWLAEAILDRSPGAWLLGLFFLAWQAILTRKGESPRELFQTYLKEIPEYRIYAPDHF